MQKQFREYFGLSAKTPDQLGNNLLRLCWRNSDDTEKMQRLIRQGAKLDALMLRTPTAQGRLDVVKMLAEAGAPFDVKDSWGVTPLVNAVLCEREDIAGYYLDKGADFMAKTHQQGSAFEIALEGHKRGFLKHIAIKMVGMLACKQTLDTTMRWAQENGQQDIVQAVSQHPLNGGLSLPKTYSAAKFVH